MKQFIAASISGAHVDRLKQHLRARHLVFGTEPLGAGMTALPESTRFVPPVTGPTNVYKLKSYVLPVSLIEHLAKHLRTQ
jgi:hypothetical protein